MNSFSSSETQTIVRVMYMNYYANISSAIDNSTQESVLDDIKLIQKYLDKTNQDVLLPKLIFVLEILNLKNFYHTIKLIKETNEQCNILTQKTLNDQFIFKTKLKYPDIIFNSNNFIKVLQNYISDIKTTIGIDLSNDESINNKDIFEILTFLKSSNIRLSFLNLSNTGIDNGYFIKYLVNSDDFHCLNIVGTPLEMTNEKFHSKVIFISKNNLWKENACKVKKYSQQDLERHEFYYKLQEAI